MSGGLHHTLRHAADEAEALQTERDDLRAAIKTAAELLRLPHANIKAARRVLLVALLGEDLVASTERTDKE